MRTPKQVRWIDMQDCLDTAQAFLAAFVMGDNESQGVISNTFIKGHIDEGDADKMIYALATVCALNIISICDHFEVDPVSMLQVANEMRIQYENEIED